ncbi:HD domain-containing protein, related [Neospora caninum Liverpool]|uniref:5'-deoxynucleotidase n=1 Tax=Neospora caninum (strain Liverpool) TaxID=572307 RepID=F0VMJ7_NEOCL|nr:HD domain-containing protein, related [Neospora caninum Liverpool]CBZ54943.1 HD domain-containing protein, related [Neospora caninum Liverpool]CEL69665.1 TPA: HD domain-containing protein, related [Neospora caninum Liverpool]|eukprot:XP_003884971.1 HD domain-containing protein, related [Neospora caninum Liverpool]
MPASSASPSPPLSEASAGGAGSEGTCYCSLLNFLLIVGKLKKLKRTGWKLCEVREPESVAEHSFRAGICAFLLGTDPQSAKLIRENKLDRNKCIKMALVHDLAEALAGDITPHCGVSAEAKRQREREALQKIVQPLPASADSPFLSCDRCRRTATNEQTSGGEVTPPVLPVGEEILSLWEEYEEGTTEEAKYVFDIDKFEMILQAFEYESDPSQAGPSCGPFYHKAQEEAEEKQQPSNKDAHETPAVADEHGPRKRRRVYLPTFYRSTENVFRSDLFRGLDFVLRNRRETLPQVRRAAVMDARDKQDAEK